MKKNKKRQIDKLAQIRPVSINKTISGETIIIMNIIDKLNEIIDYMNGEYIDEQ